MVFDITVDIFAMALGFVILRDSTLFAAVMLQLDEVAIGSLRCGYDEKRGERGYLVIRLPEIGKSDNRFSQGLFLEFLNELIGCVEFD